MVINGKAALRDQSVRPFVAGFPGNRHVVKNMTFGKDVVVVEWSFEAIHSGEAKDHTAARIYSGVTTLLKQISPHQPQMLQNLLIAWFAARAYSKTANVG